MPTPSSHFHTYISCPLPFHTHAYHQFLHIYIAIPLIPVISLHRATSPLFIPTVQQQPFPSHHLINQTPIPTSSPYLLFPFFLNLLNPLISPPSIICSINNPRRTKNISQPLRLRQIFNGVFLKVNKVTTNMLHKVEPQVTRGYTLHNWYSWKYVYRMKLIYYLFYLVMDEIMVTCGLHHQEVLSRDIAVMKQSTRYEWEWLSSSLSNCRRC